MTELKIFFLSAMLLLFTTNITSAAPFDSSVNFDNAQLVSFVDDEEEEEEEEEEEGEEEEEEGEE